MNGIELSPKSQIALGFQACKFKHITAWTEEFFKHLD